MTAAIAIIGGLAIVIYFFARYFLLDRAGFLSLMFVMLMYAMMSAVYTLALMKTHYNWWVIGVGALAMIWPLVICVWLEERYGALDAEGPWLILTGFGWLALIALYVLGLVL